MSAPTKVAEIRIEIQILCKEGNLSGIQHWDPLFYREDP